MLPGVASFVAVAIIVAAFCMRRYRHVAVGWLWVSVSLCVLGCCLWAMASFAVRLPEWRLALGLVFGALALIAMAVDRLACMDVVIWGVGAIGGGRNAYLGLIRGEMTSKDKIVFALIRSGLAIVGVAFGIAVAVILI